MRRASLTGKLRERSGLQGRVAPSQVCASTRWRARHPRGERTRPSGGSVASARWPAEALRSLSRRTKVATELRICWWQSCSVVTMRGAGSAQSWKRVAGRVFAAIITRRPTGGACRVLRRAPVDRPERAVPVSSSRAHRTRVEAWLVTADGRRSDGGGFSQLMQQPASMPRATDPTARRVRYEGYGPGNAAVSSDCQTTDRAATTAALRRSLLVRAGNLASAARSPISSTRSVLLHFAGGGPGAGRGIASLALEPERGWS